jgi:hypothetical protein
MGIRQSQGKNKKKAAGHAAANAMKRRESQRKVRRDATKTRRLGAA